MRLLPLIETCTPLPFSYQFQPQIKKQLVGGLFQFPINSSFRTILIEKDLGHNPKEAVTRESKLTA